MARPMFKVRTGAYIFDSKGRLLLMKNLRGTWGIVGGHLELGESVEEGLRREIREETCLEVTLGKLIDVFSDKDNLIIIYSATTENTDVVMSDEHLDWAWVSIDDIESYDLTYPDIAENSRAMFSEMFS